MNTRSKLIASTVAAMLWLGLSNAHAQQSGAQGPGRGGHGSQPPSGARPDHPPGQHAPDGDGSGMRPQRPDGARGAPPSGSPPSGTPPFGDGNHGSGGKQGGRHGPPPSGSTPPFSPPAGG